MTVTNTSLTRSTPSNIFWLYSDAKHAPHLLAATPRRTASMVRSRGYDNAGNVTTSGTGRTFTYDAENRQKSATVNNQTTTYAYDGDGRRVQKVAPSGTTVYVYDPFGNLAQEYGASTDTGT